MFTFVTPREKSKPRRNGKPRPLGSRSRLRTRLDLELLESRVVPSTDLAVTHLTPLGPSGHPFDLLDIQFSKAVRDGTFTLADVTVSGPGGTITPSVLTRVAPNDYQLNLMGLTGSGTYTLTVGPQDILGDDDGQPMNQYHDVTPGKPSDAYQAVLFSSSVTIAASNASYDGKALIVDGTTATIDGTHAFDSVEVVGGATITHDATTSTTESKIAWQLANGLWIDSTSKIDVSARGYLGGYTVGNTTTGGTTGWAGGSYGGLGGAGGEPGAANWVYGDYTNPDELGSGGGTFLGGQQSTGGGLVRITAATAQIDGSILANGGSVFSCSGGSGGGIRLDVSRLAGAGTIAANGGNGSEYAGGGGGGRVAIYFSDMSQFTAAHVTANGSSAQNGVGGGVGTVYLKNTSAGGEGVLRIDSHGTPAGTWTPLGMSSDTAFNVDHLVISGAGVVAAPAYQIPIVANNVDIQNGGVLTHQATTATTAYSLLVTIAKGLTVDKTSKIDVSARGYLAGYTVGNTTIGGATGSTGSAGGSYGGLGGGSGTNWVYGDYTNPDDLGSGGCTVYGVGYSGGGLARITAATAQIDGSILANGGSGGGVRGGGSGGGILLDVGTLVGTGTGTIMANGGHSDQGLGGGGGRVAIYYAQLSGFDTTKVSANAGTGGGNGNGGVGTVYLKNTSAGGEGVLRIDSHGTPAGTWTPLGMSSDTAFNVDHLVISGAGVVAAPAYQIPIVANNVDIQNGAVLTHQATTATTAYSLVLTIAKELTVDASSKIDVSARGYLAGYTVGNTTTGGATGTGGGSYGGLGGVGRVEAGRRTGSMAITPIPMTWAAAAVGLARAAGWCGSRPPRPRLTAASRPTAATAAATLRGAAAAGFAWTSAGSPGPVRSRPTAAAGARTAPAAAAGAWPSITRS